MSTIGSAEENQFVNSLCDGYSVWLGATDADLEGDWKWLDGTPWNYSNWSDYQPSNDPRNDEGRESYPIMNDVRLGAPTGYWNDSEGCYQSGFVCEYDGYTVTFDANGGSGTMNSQAVAPNASFTLPACTFTAPVGKRFKAWSIGGTEYAVGATYSVTADTTVTAVWEIAFAAKQLSDGSVNWQILPGAFSGDGMVIVATYDNNGKMLDCKTTAVKSLSNGASDTVHLITQATGSYKVLLLDAISFSPLAAFVK